jgi:hypothetical protein
MKRQSFKKSFDPLLHAKLVIGADNSIQFHIDKEVHAERKFHSVSVGTVMYAVQKLLETSPDPAIKRISARTLVSSRSTHDEDRIVISFKSLEIPALAVPTLLELFTNHLQPDRPVTFP